MRKIFPSRKSFCSFPTLTLKVSSQTLFHSHLNFSFFLSLVCLCYMSVNEFVTICVPSFVICQILVIFNLPTLRANFVHTGLWNFPMGIILHPTPVQYKQFHHSHIPLYCLSFPVSSFCFSYRQLLICFLVSELFLL